MAVERIKIWYTFSGGSLDNGFCLLLLKLSTMNVYCLYSKYTKNKFDEILNANDVNCGVTYNYT